MKATKKFLISSLLIYPFKGIIYTIVIILITSYLSIFVIILIEYSPFLFPYVYVPKKKKKEKKPQIILVYKEITENANASI